MNKFLFGAGVEDREFKCFSTNEPYIYIIEENGAIIDKLANERELSLTEFLDYLNKKTGITIC